MNPKATFFFVALSAPLLEKNHDPSYALLIGFLIVATGTVGWILWALVFAGSPFVPFTDGMPEYWMEYCPLCWRGSDSACCILLAAWRWKIFPDAEMEERLFSCKNNSGIDNDSIISHTSAPAVESRTRTHVSGKARKFSINTFYL